MESGLANEAFANWSEIAEMILLSSVAGEVDVYSGRRKESLSGIQ